VPELNAECDVQVTRIYMRAANYTIYTWHSAFGAPHCVMGTPDVGHRRIITLIFNEGMGHFPIQCTFFLSKKENIALSWAL